MWFFQSYFFLLWAFFRNHFRNIHINLQFPIRLEITVVTFWSCQFFHAFLEILARSKKAYVFPAFLTPNWENGVTLWQSGKITYYGNKRKTNQDSTILMLRIFMAHSRKKSFVGLAHCKIEKMWQLLVGKKVSH